MERLLGNVYSDYPELEKLNIQVRAVDDIKGAVVHISDGGHDPWIDSANLQYSQYLNYGDRSDEFTKPNLSDAPWRQ